MSESTDARPVVLVPVDFSPASAAAALLAIRLAPVWGADLLLLHVVHVPADDLSFYEVDPADWDRTVQTLKGSAERLMSRFRDELLEVAADSELLRGCRQRLVHGSPAGRIVEVAADEGAAAIVMGSRGRTGLRRLLLGSTAARVAALAAVPVTVVKAPGQAPEEGEGEGRS